MSRKFESGSDWESAKRNGMRPLVLEKLPNAIRRMIKKKAWRDEISYEKAVVELLYDLEIERNAALDFAMMERDADWDRDGLPF